jgi:hypothetical protein
MPDTNESQPTIAKTIQAPASDLQLVISEVKHCHLNAAVRNEASKPEKSPLMVDFDVFEKRPRPSTFFIRLLVEVENNTDAQDKLSFSISTISAFEYTPNGKVADLPDDEEKLNTLFASGVGVAINMIRGYLTNYLAPTSYRGYLLPLIDLKKLVKKISSTKVLPQLPDLPTQE